jgi:hypothetical protein
VAGAHRPGPASGEVLPDGTYLAVLVNRRSAASAGNGSSPRPAPDMRSTPTTRTWSGWSTTTCPTGTGAAPEN